MNIIDKTEHAQTDSTTAFTRATFTWSWRRSSCPGATLREAIRTRAIGTRSALAYGRQIALALDAAHEKGFEFAAGARTRIVELGKPWSFGMALSPDGTLLFSLVNSAGSNLMLVENFR